MDTLILVLLIIDLAGMIAVFANQTALSDDVRDMTSKLDNVPGADELKDLEQSIDRLSTSVNNNNPIHPKGGF